MTTDTVHTLSVACEEQLERLRERRPWLASRIDRAESILTTHLSCVWADLIRVRISKTGMPRFLVHGADGAVYTVDPADWSCSCPDHHRHGRGCKHALACYVLSRAGRGKPAAATGSCADCKQRFALSYLFDVPEGHEMFFEGERLCTDCARGAGVS